MEPIMIDFELIRLQARKPGGAWGIHGDRDAAKEDGASLGRRGERVLGDPPDSRPYPDQQHVDPRVDGRHAVQS